VNDASQIIAAVEVGTSKVFVLVASMIPGKSLNIIGQACLASKGIQKGEIVHFKLAAQKVHEALAVAETSANKRIETVFLSQTGGDLQGFFSKGTVHVAQSNQCVGAQDIQRAKEDAKGRHLPKGRVYVQHIQNPFFLDSREVMHPLGMTGEQLEIGYWSVHASEQKVRDLIHLINNYGLGVSSIVLSSIASGSITTTAEERQAGVLVLDIGCGTTDYVLYRKGVAMATGVVPVGGDHLTNDLSLGLRISLSEAEKFKLTYGDISGKNTAKQFNAEDLKAVFGQQPLPL
jgi:cell division protein FtsA